MLALVITIILIIILAVVAINFAFGENGLVSKAQQGKLLHDIEYTREKLGAVLVDALVEKRLNAEYNQDDFLDDFIYAREQEAEATEDEISLNGHTFELDRSVPQLGEYIGEAGNLPPRIRKVEVTNKTLSDVSVDVTTARADGATYRYSFKKNDEDDSSYQGNVEQAGNTYTFSNLETLVIYNLRVELIKDGAVADTEVINVLLGELEEGSLTFGTTRWQGNGTASLPVSTTTSNQIQYQIDGITEGSWTIIANNGNIPNIPNGATVFARLWDGNHGSEYISRTIVDDVKPTLTYTINPETQGAESVTITVTATDKESGLASITTPDGEQSKTSATATADYTVTTNGEYAFTAKDQAGNVSIELKVNIGNIVVDVDRAKTEGDIDILWVNENNQIIDEPETPSLSEGMTPVKWNGSNWVKTTSTDQDWYNYGNKEWANIVLEPESGLDADGDQPLFDENGILDESSNYSMLVWIPRYAYKMTYYTSSDKVNIEGYSNSDGITDASGRVQEGTERPDAIEVGDKFVLHPAFDYGDDEIGMHHLRGFWVGKFETSHTGCTTSSSTGQSNTNVTTLTAQIKAGVTSWRNIQVSNIYTVCTELNKNGNPYGLNTNDTVVDPHVMKNSEWGAVAYLSKNTTYGKGNEVWINPNIQRITGQAGGGPSVAQTSSTNAYNTTNGQQASTSGNTTGIYDMSGGAYEFVAAYIDVISNYPGADEYSIDLVNADERYKDVYIGKTDLYNGNGIKGYMLNGNKYGDAVFETSDYIHNVQYYFEEWYRDSLSFPYISIEAARADFPCFTRGGASSGTTGAGIFGFKGDAGRDGSTGFRVSIPVL